MTKLAQQPLYRQVMRAVLNAVQSGEWPEGDALPSEAELGVRFGVSQGTVRKALDVLVADGILERHQGVGTFVTAVSDYLAALRFGGLAGEGGAVPAFELLGCVRVHAGEVLADMLGVRRGAGLWQVRRLIRVRSQRIGLEEIYLPEDVFPALDARRIREFGCNLPAVCWRDFGVLLKDAEVRVKAVRAGTSEARLIGCEVNDPLLQLVRLLHDLDGNAQMWCSAWLVSDELAVDLPAVSR
ncbi:GntR family transcriptional regulator [Chitinibacteraceae bacterium HSL-7]